MAGVLPGVVPTDRADGVAITWNSIDLAELLTRLERVASVPFSRIWVLAITAEAQAALERWDDLDETLATLDALSGTDQLPRAVAQIDRARGLAGDELALARAEAGFRRLGCVFEQARCLELMGRVGEARAVYEQVGAEPALGRCASR